MESTAGACVGDGQDRYVGLTVKVKEGMMEAAGGGLICAIPCKILGFCLKLVETCLNHHET